MKLISLLRRLLMNPEKYARHIGVNIGSHNYIVGNKCWSSEPYLITIGSHCQVAHGVRFITHGGGHVVRKSIPDFDTFGKITVGDWVYIGTNALIMPGVSIGSGSLVAAGSVVTRSIPPAEVWAGVPARRICSVSEYLTRHLPFNTHTAGIPPRQKRKILLSLHDSAFIQK